MAETKRAAHLAVELAFEAPAVRQTSQMIGESGFFAYIKVRLEFEQCACSGEQQIEIGGIRDVTQGPDLRGTTQVFNAATGRGLHDYRDELRQRIGPYSLGQFVAVHARHHHVCNHQIRLIGFNRREGFVAIRGRTYAITSQAQSGLEQTQLIGTVVNYQNVGFWLHKRESWTVIVLYCSCAAMSFMLQCRNSVTVSRQYSPKHRQKIQSRESTQAREHRAGFLTSVKH